MLMVINNKGFSYLEIIISIAILVIIGFIGFGVYHNRPIPNLNNIPVPTKLPPPSNNVPVNSHCVPTANPSLNKPNPSGQYPAHYLQFIAGCGLEQIGTLTFTSIANATVPNVNQQYFGFTPDVIKLLNGQYRMYYTGNAIAGNNDQNIVSAISNNDITWTQEPGIRVPHGSSTSGDYQIQYPAVIYGPGNKYYMSYQGRAQNASSSGINCFFATSNDGLNWTKISNDSLPGCGKVALEYINGKFELITGLARFESYDFIHWQNKGMVLPLTADPGGIIHVNGAYYMPIQGYAISPPPTNNDPEDIFIIVSKDGINWPNKGYLVLWKQPNGNITDLNAKQYGFESSISIAPDGSIILYHDPLPTSGPAPMFGMKLSTPLPNL